MKWITIASSERETRKGDLGEMERGGSREMFLGEHQHTLDAKGRVSLPAKFRVQMCGKIVIAQGIDKNLHVYEAAEYEKFVSKLLSREAFTPAMRQMRVFFTAGAEETELDSAGRVTIPSPLREYAELKRDVVVTGNGSRIDIWDADAWRTYKASAAESIDAIAQELADAGLW